MGDYSALAQRVSTSISGVRGCLMLSRDGLVLGADPEDGESELRSAWVRFASLGDPERSYVEFPDRIWAFVRRGGYGAFAVADADVRPGLLMDVLDQVLMTGEQERTRERDTLRVPEAAGGKRKRRLKVHKPQRAVAPEPAVTPAPTATPPASAEPPESEAEGPQADRPMVPGSTPAADAQAQPSDAPPKDDESEVDRILLAKEFAGLLQVSREDDEASG